MATKFEYLISQGDVSSSGGEEAETFDSVGYFGWEMVSYCERYVAEDDNTIYTAVFKRKKKNKLFSFLS